MKGKEHMTDNDSIANFSLLSRFQCYTPSDPLFRRETIPPEKNIPPETTISVSSQSVARKQDRTMCDDTMSVEISPTHAVLVPLLELTSIRWLHFHLLLPHLRPVGAQNSSSAFLHTLHHGSSGIWISS